jgi:hypothetical protein
MFYSQGITSNNKSVKIFHNTKKDAEVSAKRLTGRLYFKEVFYGNCNAGNCSVRVQIKGY